MPDGPGMGRSRRVTIAAGRARTRAARATSPQLPPRWAAYLRQAARGWADPGAYRSQRAKHVHVRLVRRVCLRRHSGRLVGTGRPKGGPYQARHDRSELSTYTCSSCDATAAVATAVGVSALCGPGMGRSRRVAIAASRARTRAARATRPPPPPRRAAYLRWAAQGWADPGASRSQRPGHVHVPLVRCDRRCRHGERLVGAGRPKYGSLPARRDRSEPSTYTCRTCDATASAATAGDVSAPGGPRVGRSRRVAITASQNVRVPLVQRDRPCCRGGWWVSPGGPSVGCSRCVAIAASRARTRAARATRPQLPPWRAAYLRQSARGWASPGALRSQRAEHVHVLLVRRDRPCRSGGWLVCAGRPKCGLLPALRDRSQPNTYACRTCDVTATTATADGRLRRAARVRASPGAS